MVIDNISACNTACRRKCIHIKFVLSEYIFYQYTTAKYMQYTYLDNIMKKTHSYLHFDLLEIVWHEPQTTIATLMLVSPVVLWAEMELVMSEIKDTK